MKLTKRVTIQNIKKLCQKLHPSNFKQTVLSEKNKQTHLKALTECIKLTEAASNMGKRFL
jgi:hypothetical protein